MLEENKEEKNESLRETASARVDTFYILRSLPLSLLNRVNCFHLHIASPDSPRYQRGTKLGKLRT